MNKLYKYINPKEVMKMGKSQKRAENILKQVRRVLTQNGKIYGVIGRILLRI